ncbi:phosphodiester glycosidase family protein [Microlunatus speluncae]|uniref:phosphodiester glycosidase family protein n=1 Tax=Microlunatus speluncae TaxID=2594267 RepID=UPI0012661F19|nr:phosphodiester glycosidase family protein [Microlunatus speluncae]
MARRVLAGLLAVLTGLSLVSGTIAYAEPPTGPELSGAGSTLLQQREVRVAPGLDLTSFQRLQPGGWVTGSVLTADLSVPTLSLDVEDGGTVSASKATVSEFAAAGRAVAAVNGDYFDLNRSEAPIGTNISPTGGLRTAAAEARQAFTLTDGKAAVRELMSDATVEINGIIQQVRSVNSPSFAADSVGLFNRLWGTFPVGRLIPAGEPVRVLTVVDGKITASSTDRSVLDRPLELPAGGSALVARGRGTELLAGAEVGDEADLIVRADADVDLAVGGDQRLLEDGKPTDQDQVAAARTAIGISKDGSSLSVVSIDGRQGDAHGMTIAELARLMQDLGAWNAINLDGGGSTTLVARPAGTKERTVINRPSDGQERADANALVFRSTAPATPVKDVALRPALEPAAGLARPEAYDLLPGLSRTVVGTGLDGNLAAAPVTGHFQARPGGVVGLASSRVKTEAIVVGHRRGTGTVSYQARQGKAEIPIRVHGPMTRLEPSSPIVALPDADATATLTLTAVDADGHRVPVEAADVTIDAAAGAEVVPGAVGRFTVTPTITTGASSVTFTVQDHRVTVPITIGHTETPLADFADPADWKVETARATGSLSAATGPDGGPALGLDFDFTQTTATRGMYAVPVQPIAIAGQPQALTLWINGTGKGEWPRIQITRGDGTSTNLDGPNIDWTGWRQVRFPVPAGTKFPLTLTALRFMEIRSDASYTDRLEIAGLVAQVPPEVQLPEQPELLDPVIISQGSVADRPQRIAVMSDSQFVGRDPDSELVAAARRTLREIVAAKPDLLVINGDFVDEAAMIDFQLAKRILDEEVGGKLPYVYVPGNHEIMGGPIGNFESIFGAAATQRDLGRTKIITLNSSSGHLHPGGSTDQLRMLESQLSAAAADPELTGVLVFQHHPIDDPHPDKASQLGDRYEAAALDRVLADFQADHGKSVALVNGHVGTFFAEASGGVSRVINGNSGKSPSGAPDEGGFTGWSMLGVDPEQGKISADRSRLDWLRVETLVRVDDIFLSAPTAMVVGGVQPATAKIIQDGDREVPVSWPVSARWGGAGVWIGDPERQRPDPRATLAYDPGTGELTALRPGLAELEVIVNGVTARQTISVD